ncbi:hypothetical protein [Ectopseudomonas mendocina]|uniref:Uncharacterized protein n=1 Tax=Ectopseudomonas mendocina S5.2 TaxID=1225174 RepID=A0ABN4IW79_ECTME|nr:hypothetical protein [Pseudomonas mendocina]ALN20064.1 hypothetical protein DW68_015960 [Pseudomonas mendocina S5.2]KER99038.1 hypothetical protein HN51_04115 [Pseudomonas mendocina]
MDFEHDGFDADEELAEINDYYGEYPRSEFAWLYIAVDIRDMEISKIGLTTKKSPEQRLAEGKTYNPFIVLFATYELSKTTNGISRFELGEIEGYIHRRSFADPVLHLYTGRSSEWFYMHPDLAESEVDRMLAKRGFTVEGKRLYSFYEGDHNHNGIYVSRMKRIKKIYRPFPEDFNNMAKDLRLPKKYYQEYLDYLLDYHSRDFKDKSYL